MKLTFAIDRIKDRYQTAITAICEAHSKKEKRENEIAVYRGSPHYNDEIMRINEEYNSSISKAKQDFISFAENEHETTLRSIQAHEDSFSPTVPNEEEYRLLTMLQTLPKNTFTAENICNFKCQIHTDIGLNSLASILNNHNIRDTTASPSRVYSDILVNCVETVKAYQGYRSFSNTRTLHAAEFGKDIFDFCYNVGCESSESDIKFAVSRQYDINNA